MKKFIIIKAEDGTEYKIRFSHNVMCEIERQLKMSIAELGDKLGGNISMTEIRTLIRILIKENGSDISPAATGDLIDDVGLIEICNKMVECIQIAFPEPEKTTEANDNPTEESTGDEELGN